MNELFDSASLTEAGGRKHNQDAFGTEMLPKAACWVLADGLGGHAGGEAASRMAVDTILQLFRQDCRLSAEWIQQCFDAAQSAIIDRAESDFSLSDMRTTLVVLVSDGKKAIWGHVGDSRLYYFKHGVIRHQTKDHSVPQMLVDAGKIKFEEIRGHEDQNRLTRALGKEGTARPSILQEAVDLESGDAFLLCSDGVWGYVMEAEMEQDQQDASDASAWVEKIKARVRERATGAYDNYTAVAVFYARSKSQ